VVYDEFDQRTDRLDYQGGDEFVVAHTPLRMRIHAAGIETMLPTARRFPARARSKSLLQPRTLNVFRLQRKREENHV